MNNLYRVCFTDGTKITTTELIAEGSREEAKQRGVAKGAKYGWGAKVFPAHYAMYGKVRFDHLNRQPS